MTDILYLETTTSTNQVAFEKARQGVSQGFSVVADDQTGGRGRLGKKWQSAPGKGLYCSIVLRPNLAYSDFPKLTLSSGLGVAEALEKLTGGVFGLKWPNDIYSNLKKCCGILCESSPPKPPDDPGFAIVGVGVNVTTKREDFEPELRDTATSLLLETGREYTREMVFQEIHAHILENLEELETVGFQQILERWKDRDVLLGRKLAWVTNSGEVIYGTSLGPDSSGQLMVRDEEGIEHMVMSGDVSLARKAEG